MTISDIYMLFIVSAESYAILREQKRIQAGVRKFSLILVGIEQKERSALWINKEQTFLLESTNYLLVELHESYKNDYLNRDSVF